MITSTIESQLISFTPALTKHLADSLVILAILGLMYWFIFVTTPQLRGLGQFVWIPPMPSIWLARWLDSSTVALASFIVFLYLETSKSLQTLFRLWSAVTVLIAGIYLWGRESTYLIAIIT